jgi:acetylornithine deacetylase/succinyl-diaminopimelate desuccinylase-like protein
MLLPILATEAFFLAGEKPPVNLRFIFETEEEIGSVNLPLLVRERRDAAGLRRRVIGRWRHVEA